MYDERMERICAILSLTSALDAQENAPRPFYRKKVREMLEMGALEGLILRKNRGLAEAQLARAEALLARASSVFQRVQTYLAQGYQILLEDDAHWPEPLRKLEKDMPLYLFARGNLSLLEGKKASIAGSRAISARTGMRCRAVGRLLAEREKTIVTGGARGVDSTAAHAALRAGGNVIVIPALTAEELFKDPSYQRACEEGRLLLLCETPPDEPFSAAKALTRNHSIYALGDIAMVIAARKDIGGTWSGARACMKNAWSPVFVLDDEGEDYKGNEALIAMGAMRMQLVAEDGNVDLLLQGF